MGTDVYWNKSPLNDRIGETEIDAVMEWATPDGDDPEAATALHSVWGVQLTSALVFRVAEGLGHYFRSNMSNWPSIVSEMTHRGMIGEDVIPAARVEGNGNGEPVTPKQIFKAQDADTYPILPMLIEPGFEPEHDDVLPGLWVRWLCFMERAAEIGYGFTVS